MSLFLYLFCLLLLYCFSSLSSASTNRSRNSNGKSFKRLLPNFTTTEQFLKKQNQLSRKLEGKFVKSLANINKVVDDDATSITSLEVANILSDAPEMQPCDEDYEPKKQSESKNINNIKHKLSLSNNSTNKNTSNIVQPKSFNNNNQKGLTLFRILNLRQFDLIPITIIRINNKNLKHRTMLPFKLDEKDLCFERNATDKSLVIDKFKVLIISSLNDDGIFIFIDGILKLGDLLIEINGHCLLINCEIDSMILEDSSQINLVVARTKSRRKTLDLSNYNC